MNKFKPETINDESGLPIGIKSAQVNGREITIALKDVPESLNWHDANKCGIPSNVEWLAICENLDEVNKLLAEAGGEAIVVDDWYWSSTESYYYNPNYLNAWIVLPSNGVLHNDFKYTTNRVRCVLA